MPTVGLRFFTVYGPRQRPDLAIHKFARLIRDGKPVRFSATAPVKETIPTSDDIIKGVRAAINYDPPHNYDVFNLGNSDTVELNELISILEDTIGRKAIIDRRPTQPGDVP